MFFKLAMIFTPGCLLEFRGEFTGHPSQMSILCGTKASSSKTKASCTKMKLALQSSCLINKPPSSSFHHFRTRLIVKATTDPPSSSSESQEPNVKTSVGFGSSSSSSTVQTKDGKKGKKSKERKSVIRRTPLEKPAFLSKERETKTPEQSSGSSAESAFLLTWFGLGSLIIIEGLVLAASGLFPEEWDKYFVKYLYPSFTPTVFLFVAGTVVYGVSKYLQGENMKS